MRKVFVLALFIITLSGCASKPNVQIVESDPVVQKIALLAESIASHNAKLARIEEARYHSITGANLPTLDLSLTPALTQIVNLGADFNGPLHSLIIKLSERAGMKQPRFLNVQPAAGIAVFVSTDYRRVIDIMWDVNSQTGSRAVITYKLLENLFEVEYRTL